MVATYLSSSTTSISDSLDLGIELWQNKREGNEASKTRNRTTRRGKLESTYHRKREGSDQDGEENIDDSTSICTFLGNQDSSVS